MGNRSGWVRAALWLLVGNLVLLVPGCQSTPKRSPMMQGAPGVKGTAAELRIVARSLAPPFSGIIEEAADEIALGANDPGIRRLALQWKINAIPEIQRALYQPDPVAAFIDTWALILQMQAFFESGPAKGRLGELYPVALKACARLEDSIDQAIADMTLPDADVAGTRADVQAWVDAHPIDASLVTREATTRLLASLTAKHKLGTFRAVGSMAESVADIESRLDLYNEYLPKLARWQAEMLLLDVINDPWMSGILVNLDDTGDSLRTLARVVTDAEASIGAEGDQLVALLQDEREVLLAFIAGERLESLAYLTEERMAVLKALSAEREAVLAALMQERSATVTEIDEQRRLATEDLGEIGRELVAGAVIEVESLVDHFFVRATQFTAALLLIGGLALMLTLRATRGRR